jgi:hypothetical protein
MVKRLSIFVAILILFAIAFTGISNSTPPINYQITSSTSTISGELNPERMVICPSGLKVTGGGYEQTNFNSSMTVQSSFPFADGSGWVVRGQFTLDPYYHVDLTVYAVCVGL